MEVNSTEAQNNFGRYIKLAQFEDIIVTKNGKKIVVIKRYEEAEKVSPVISEESRAYKTGNQTITFEDFLKLAEGSENRYEYIDGEVYLLASPSFVHQSIVMELSNSLYTFLKGKKCRPLTAPFDVTLVKNGCKNVVQPDIVVICDLENVNEKKIYMGIPTLVVEVLSENTIRKDMIKKLDLYSNSGIQEYWIVNPFQKEVYVYCFNKMDMTGFRTYKGQETVKSVVFEDFNISLDQIFPA